jgi:Uri superfamily endonuclease
MNGDSAGRAQAHGARLREPGIYALLFRSQPAVVSVGALGEVVLPAGWLVYVGSAFGSGGLAGRLKHHLGPISQPRWHLDYLRTALEFRGAWVGFGSRQAEHEWAEILAELPSTTLPRERFGASDCRCASHLFAWSRRPEGRRLATRLLEKSSAQDVGFLPRLRLTALSASGESPRSRLRESGG